MGLTRTAASRTAASLSVSGTAGAGTGPGIAVSTNAVGLLFGDGADGSAAFDGTATPTGTTKSGSVYTLTRDVYYTDATLSNSSIIATAGYRIWVTGTLTVGAGCKIHADADPVFGNNLPATPATANLAPGQLPVTAYGGGNWGSGPVPAAALTRALGGRGGAGGSVPSYAAATPPTPTGPASTETVARNPTLVGVATGTAWRLAGGGAGAGGSVNGSYGSNSWYHGGGGVGGIGGGLLAIYARTIINNGTLSALGSAGGNAGPDTHTAVRAAASTNVATLSGLQTIDGIALAEGDRVLLYGQTTASNNGVRIASAGAWNRPTDWDAASDLTAGSRVQVTSGTNAGKYIAVNSNNPGFASTFTVVDPHTSVRVATTANLTSLSGLLTIDGVTLVAGDRVLVRAQTTATQNGVYVAASGAWTRATDFDATTDFNVTSYWLVTAGTTYTGAMFMINNPSGITSIGSSNVTFYEVALGGGGGGGGGAVVVVSASAQNGTVSAAGGAGGTGFARGANGATGNAGTVSWTQV